MLNKKSAVPLHDQLLLELKSKLEKEVWKAGDKIPSENELASEYSVSRMTVRSVITELVKIGVLYRVQGKGTFVSPSHMRVTTTGFQTFRQQLQTMGLPHETEVLACERIKTTPYLEQALGLSAEVQSLLYVYRVTYVEKKPICIHKAFIPEQVDHIVTKESLNRFSLFQLLEQCGYKTVNITEHIKCAFPSEQDAKVMEIRKGHPVLVVSDIHRTAAGQPFILNEYAFRGEQVSIDVQFQDQRVFDFVND